MSKNLSEISKRELENQIKSLKLELKELKKEESKSDYIHKLYDLALLQSENHQFDESIKNLEECLKYYETNPNNLGKSSIFGSLGVVCYLNEDYIKSQKNYHSALELYEKLNLKHEQIVCMKSIGLNLLKLNKLNEAVNILLECAELSSKEKKIEDFLDCISNLVQIYEIQKKWDVMIELYQKGLKAFEKLNDIKGIINSHFNLGILYKKLNQYFEALNHFKKGTNLANEGNYAESIIKGTSLIGEIYVKQNQIKKATKEFIKSLSVAKRIKANNAEAQLKILLNSMGLNNSQINIMLNEYERELNS